MTSVHRQSQVARFCLIVVGVLLVAGYCFGQPTVSLSPKDGPSTTTVRVSGSGFTPYAQIDIYFDSQDQALAVADGTGAFSQIAIQVPKPAVPGSHWVTVAERSGRFVKQEIFEVHVNWTDFHTKDMRRWNAYENVLDVTNVGKLSLVGRYRTGAEVRSSPAVANNVVYVGSDDGSVYALSGKGLLWSYQTNGAVLASPAVANGVVYVTSGDGYLYALNATTGTLLWSYATGPTGQNYPDLGSSPIVADGVVYVGSDNGNVYALDAGTGTLEWSYTTGDGWWLDSSPAVANGIVYVAAMDNLPTGNGNLYALDASTGTLLWSYFTQWTASSPAVASGVVYVGSCCGVYALKASSGALLWNFPLSDDSVHSLPAVASGTVYVGSTNAVYALNGATGAVLWRYSRAGWNLSSPAVANGVLYVGSGDGNVHALDASTGADLWSYHTSRPWPDSSPVVANGLVYIGTGNGWVYAFGLPKELAPQPPKRPDPKTLRPDFNLKPLSTTASN